MRRKQRIYLEERILSSIHAHRERTGDTGAFLAVEKAIIDRELADLNIEALLNQNGTEVEIDFRGKFDVAHRRSKDHGTRTLGGLRWQRP